MIKLLSILWNSFRMALQELRVNKLRTFLSLFGITIGIFCIIGVLATVDSLERKVQSDIKAFGNNTIYIDKWNYGGGNDYPWWKYIKRPQMRYEEMKFVKSKSQLGANAAMFVSSNVNLSYADNILSNVNLYGISEEFNTIQTIDIEAGRYINETEFSRGTTTGVIGYKVAEELYNDPQKAIGKEVTYNGRHLVVVGVIKKQGQTFVGGFDYDQSVIVPYRYFASVYDPDNSNPFIMVQGKPKIPSAALQDELVGIMRQARRLSPTEEDNFSCNDVAMFSDQVKGFFGAGNDRGLAHRGIKPGGGNVRRSQYHVRDRAGKNEPDRTKKSDRCEEKNDTFRVFDRKRILMYHRGIDRFGIGVDLIRHPQRGITVPDIYQF
jgi:putative ABC transport system permease protein